jgi:hypothetical protein
VILSRDQFRELERSRRFNKKKSKSKVYFYLNFYLNECIIESFQRFFVNLKPVFKITYSYILVPRALTRGQRRGALAKSKPDTMLWYPVWIFAWAPRRWPRVRRALGKRMIFILTDWPRSSHAWKDWDWPSSLASNFRLEVAFQWYSFHWFWFTRLHLSEQKHHSTDHYNFLAIYFRALDLYNFYLVFYSFFYYNDFLLIVFLQFTRV